MAGSREGGLLAAQKIKDTYGADFYVKLGQKAWSPEARENRRPHGFAVNRELAKIAGAKGGRLSSRAGSPNKPKSP